MRREKKLSYRESSSCNFSLTLGYVPNRCLVDSIEKLTKKDESWGKVEEVMSGSFFVRCISLSLHLSLVLSFVNDSQTMYP